MKTILLIDDDQKLGELLTSYFRPFELELVYALHPDEGLQKLASLKPALVILDVMLPGKDGFEVCKLIRRTNNAIPIIMLTARGEITDRVVGLELGADDYMPKPFDPRELVARIQSILRRVKTPSVSVLRFNDLVVDLDKQIVTLEGQRLDLTTMEFHLLVLLASTPGKTFNRDEILAKVSGIDADVFSRSIDIAISRLRQKLNEPAKHPRFIKTVWGSGYVFLGDRRENDHE